MYTHTQTIAKRTLFVDTLLDTQANQPSTYVVYKDGINEVLKKKIRVIVARRFFLAL